MAVETLSHGLYEGKLAAYVVNRRNRFPALVRLPAGLQRIGKILTQLGGMLKLLDNAIAPSLVHIHSLPFQMPFHDVE